MESVSCLMASFSARDPKRFGLFCRSVGCYRQQTYSNRELIIVTSGSGEYVAQVSRHIADSESRDVRVIVAPSGTPLGALRKIAVDNADGELVCQWDDDDINHAARLSCQIEAMRQARAPASYLADYLHLFPEARAIFWCDWGKLLLPGQPGLPGTLLAYKKILPSYRTELLFDEDSVLQRQLVKEAAGVAAIRGLGFAYVYTFHGANAFPYSHHLRTAFRASQDRDQILASASSLWRALYEHGFQPPLSITDKCGEMAFRWSGGDRSADQGSCTLKLGSSVDIRLHRRDR